VAGLHRVSSKRLQGRARSPGRTYGLVTTDTRAGTRSRIPPHAKLARRTGPVTGV
jgi:hypothetical protein